MKKMIIKIMPDYECFPLWKADDVSIENTDPNNLQITEELKTMLYEWQDKFDLTLNQEYPPESGFKSEKEEKEFREQGLKIYKMMTNQLAKNYEIYYYDFFSHKLYKSFEEAQAICSVGQNKL